MTTTDLNTADTTDLGKIRMPDEYQECVPTVNAMLYKLSGRRIEVAVAPKDLGTVAAFTHTDRKVHLASKVLREFTHELHAIDFEKRVAPEIGLLVHEGAHAQYSPPDKTGILKVFRGIAPEDMSDEVLLEALTILEEPLVEYLALHAYGGLLRTDVTNRSVLAFLVAAIAKFFVKDSVNTEDTSDAQAFSLAALLGGRSTAYEQGSQEMEDVMVPPLVDRWAEAAYDLLDKKDAEDLQTFFQALWRTPYVSRRNEYPLVYNKHQSMKMFHEQVFGITDKYSATPDSVPNLQTYLRIAAKYLTPPEGESPTPKGDEGGEDEDNKPNPKGNPDAEDEPKDDGGKSDPTSDTSPEKKSRTEKVAELIERVCGADSEDSDSAEERVVLHHQIQQIIEQDQHKSRLALQDLRRQTKRTDWM